MNDRRVVTVGKLIAGAAFLAVILRASAVALVAAVLIVASGGHREAKGAPVADLRLAHAAVKPAVAFFDAQRKVALRYRLRAAASVDLRIRVVRKRSGRVVRHWRERNLRAGVTQVRRWNGRRRGRGPVADGRYAFELAALAARTRRSARFRRAGGFRLQGHRFPVPGGHAYGDRFGVARSGGRRHEGQDVVASCGSRLVAARGGRVQARGYSHSLYGHWLLIDARGERADHFYSHLISPSPLPRGARVRTGERIGAVGKSGNARHEFCQLHFELWPRGYRNGSAVDPLPALRRWDGWS